MSTDPSATSEITRAALPAPYYSDEHVTLYHADNRDVIPHIDFDLVFTSPPYNLSDPDRKKKPSGTSYKALADGYASYGDNMPHAEYVAWQNELTAAIWQKLPETGAMFYNHKQINRDGVARLPLELVDPECTLRQVITWDRSSGHINCHWYYTPRTEWVLLYAKQGFRLNQLGVFDLWKVPFETGTEHPAPFPLALPMRALTTVDFDTVFDPFSGSGTTLRAAKDLGKRAIGCEVDERYCEIAATRMAQGVLF